MPETVVIVISYAWAGIEPAARWEVDNNAMKRLIEQGETGANAAAALRVAARCGARGGEALEDRPQRANPLLPGGSRPPRSRPGAEALLRR